MERMTLYCDESGSTGTNWSDKDQPFLVYGGWLVPDEKKTETEKGIRAILDKYPGKEIKANRFFKMGKGNEYFKRVFDYMMNIPCIPFFIITHKRYIIAPKIIETFFDPAYNASLSDEITGDTEYKKALSEIVLRNEELIEAFSRLLRSESYGLVNIKEIQKLLITTFSAVGMKTLTKNIVGLNDSELLDMLKEFQVDKPSKSLTIPTLNYLMQILDSFCEACNIQALIVHDIIRGYDDWLETIKGIYLSPGEQIILHAPSFSLRSKLKNVSDIYLKDSKDEVLIQMADLLCGFIARCFIKIERNDTLDDIELLHMQYMLPLYVKMNVWECIFPEGLFEKYLRIIGVNVNDPIPADYKKLDRKFKMYIS